ncbi:MAG: cob(I)yrinic acid a,c-diamide adenosyltransferase [Negativicutes bacterium]|nr:cob(I)yrinic acid a,c-diamide adenosyltransferase [Negativicutes bacterium]
MKIYTKTGDKGTTGLYTGERVAKDCLRVEVYGTIDEADAALGLARSLATKQDVRAAIISAQKTLWTLMADFASIGDTARITAEQVMAIEAGIDTVDKQLPPLTQFVIPGDSPASSALHMARTIIRRAERLAWKLSREEDVNDQALVMLNRLSDYCFVLARREVEE